MFTTISGRQETIFAKFGPYLTDRYRTPWGNAINFDDSGSDEVRHFVCDNALMWLRDYRVDGLRLDAVHAIFDASAIHVLEQLATRFTRSKRTSDAIFVIAESDLNLPRIVTPREVGGYGLDAQWNDDFHHALHAILTREHAGYFADFGSLANLAKALTRPYVYDGMYSMHRNRVHGTPVTGLSATSVRRVHPESRSNR